MVGDAEVLVEYVYMVGDAEVLVESVYMVGEEIFKDAIPPYQNDLKKCGYDFEMKYQPSKPNKGRPKSRKRKIIWFNPPWSANCRDNVGNIFLRIVDTCFSPSHPLHKIFNRNTLKVSYSCLPNMAMVISSHNSKVKSKDQDIQPPGCNCRKGVAHCPLNGACQTQGLIYGAKVTKTSDQTTEFYTGLTARKFKERHYEHTASFRKESLRHKTTLSDHIWKLKTKDEPHTVNWWVIDRGRPFHPPTRSCDI